MTGPLQDLRYAVHQLRKSPGFAATAVLTLALGIGANTGIFTLVNAVLLKSLPVPNPQQLYLVKQSNDVGENLRISYPLFERLRAATPSSVQIAAMSWPSRFYASTGDSQPESVTGQLVSGAFFPLFETYPVLGRLLTPDDNRVPDDSLVAVISYSYWQRRFGRANDVIGRKLTINRMPFTIIGVSAPEFFGATPDKAPDFWIPALTQHSVHYSAHYSSDSSDPAKPWISQEGISWLRIIIRAKSAQAANLTTAALNQVFHQNLERAALTVADSQQRAELLQLRLELEPGSKGLATLRQALSRPLLLLMGMVGLVLLIACANIANLLLARAAVREREIAIRLAVGASRLRLIRQLLTECLLLSLTGAVVGVGVAYWCSTVLPRWAGLADSLNFAPDATVLLFSCAIVTATAILFGLAPALQGTQVKPVSVLKANVRGTSTNRHAGSQWSFKQVLVVSQVALSLVLLVGAGLFVRTLRNFSQLDPGFAQNRLLSVWIDTHLLGFKPEQLAQLYDRLLNRVAEVPGVRSASLAGCGLASSCTDSSNIYLAGTLRDAGVSQTNTVSLRYFSNIGIPLLRGRDFTTADNATSPKVVVVNQTFVRRFFPQVNPVGHRFGYGATSNHEFEIIGVVADARVNDIREEAPPMMYFPLAQSMGNVDSLDVRTAADPQWLASQVRQAVKETEPNLPIILVTTLSDQVRSNLGEQRLIARLTTMFGLLALGLACLGLYGVMSYSVARRTSELGIRLALGSTRPGVLWLVLRETLIVVGSGIAAGVFLSLITTRVASSLLFGIRPNDPATIGVAAFVLLAMALAAAYLPARRAAKVEPMEALRYE